MLINPNLKEAVQRQSLPLDRVCVIILAGGKGTRLEPLTRDRCKPAVSFGGRYSLIDVPISHSLSTGLTKIYVVGQYLSHSLSAHLSRTYLNYGVHQQRIDLLTPEERPGEKVWYQGTADAVRQNLSYFRDVDADYFLILSGDQLYNINFRDMIDFGVESDASMVIATQPVDQNDAKRMGLLRLAHGSSRVVDFHEKPQEDALLQAFHTDDFTLQHLGFEAIGGRNFLGSMGIYLFKRESLFDLLSFDQREDFGKHLISSEMKRGAVHSYLYDGYWEDIGTIESYYNANLALTQSCHGPKNGLDCYDERSLIITKSHDLPGAQIHDCQLSQALICEGSVIHAKRIHRSVIGVRTQIGEDCIVEGAVLLGNEYYQRPALNRGEAARRPGIGKNCVIRKAIIDENVTIGDNVRLENLDGHCEYASDDGKIFVKEGIIIIPRGTQIPSNTTF